MSRFVVLLQFGDHDERMRVRPSHREYLHSLHEQGKLITAGPYADDTGAMLVYEAADEAEVRSLLDADPYFTAGAKVAEVVSIREWTPILP